MKFTFIDRERNLQYSFRDIKQLREKYFGSSTDEFKLDAIPEIVSTGLKREDAEMTSERAADIIDMATFTELCEAISEASGLGRPNGDGRPTQGSLRSSGPSPVTTSGSPNPTSGD
jgi:hypothetical protein